MTSPDVLLVEITYPALIVDFLPGRPPKHFCPRHKPIYQQFELLQQIFSHISITLVNPNFLPSQVSVCSGYSINGCIYIKPLLLPKENPYDPYNTNLGIRSLGQGPETLDLTKPSVSCIYYILLRVQFIYVLKFCVSSGLPPPQGFQCAEYKTK